MRHAMRQMARAGRSMLDLSLGGQAKTFLRPFVRFHFWHGGATFSRDSADLMQASHSRNS